MRQPDSCGKDPWEDRKTGKRNGKGGVQRVQRGVEDVADACDVDARVAGKGMVAVNPKDQRREDDGEEQR
jgi:hypothetical protein